MSEEILRTEQDAAVLVLTLNRPRTKNALNRALVGALADGLESAARDNAVRVIVLTGAGDSFCAGADLKAAMQDSSGFGDAGVALDQYHRMIRAIAGAPKPVIAMVGGPAVGFGCDLALACDLRILSSDAYLQEKFVKIGLMPDGGGTFWLPRLVGLARAMELMLTGRPIPAAEALSLGIANRVVSADALRDETMALARELAQGPPLAFAAIKRAVSAGLGGTIDTALELEKAGQLRCLQSADCMEGIMAWMQKRPPAFEGK
jgi:2-(1,2-epoxy-1,2-dihydrophenyl)acetyl-CoA isomerase